MNSTDYHRSKPIRRPQLKKVLKEYCAPIPEEPEDVSPEERRGSGASTTVVIVNGGAATAALPEILPATIVSPPSETGPPVRPDIRPVSPRDTS